MEEAFISRIRASASVSAVAGSFDGRSATQWMERESDEPNAFPAALFQVISPGRKYDLDGPSRLQMRTIRIEYFGLSYGSAKLLSRAMTGLLETAGTHSGVRFYRGQLRSERDFQPEDLPGDLKIFRTVQDFTIATST